MGAAMLERHEVEAFLAVAEELHFGRAAARLRISPARVSQIVRGLERRVGAPLFERTSRRVALTAIGRRLYDDAAPAWTLLGDAVRRATDGGRGLIGALTAAFAPAAGGLLLVQVAELFRQRHPECAVHIREARPGVEADVSLVALPAGGPGLTVGGVLVREARMLARPAGGPPDGPRLDDPDASLAELLTLVGAGRGTLEVGAHTRRYHARPDVGYDPLPGAPPVEWGLVWRTAAETARIRAFNRAALDLVQS
jgi:hypothetical protein